MKAPRNKLLDLWVGNEYHKPKAISGYRRALSDKEVPNESIEKV
jgi:hypothetical protein